MKIRNMVKGLLAIFCVLALLVTLPQKAIASTNTDTFKTVISNNLSSWGLDSPTSSLTYDKFSLLLENNNITGENAAALAAICEYMRIHNKSTVNLTITKSLALETIAQDSKTLSYYNKFCIQLPNIPETLYAKQTPDFASLQQGPAGDCFFFSAIGWLAKYRPMVIMKSIQTNSAEGIYTVNFPDGKTTTVNAPTQAEILFNNSPESIGNGLWITVLEKATGAVMPQITSKTYSAADPQAYIDSGGKPEPIEQLWSGNTPKTISFHTELEKISKAKQIREALIDMQNKNLLAQAGGVASSSNDIPLPGHHVYAILAYDDNTKILTVWNPWGTDFTPKGLDGPTNGYTRQHGVFHISLKDFIQIYGYLCAVEVTRA